jgi:F-type H+-transporting ATPase subunit delta
MKDRKPASRYAHALLSALNRSEAEEADRFLHSLREAMEEDAGTRDFLLDPAIPSARRKSVLTSLARESGMPRQIANFLEAVVDHHRSALLPTIAQVFHEERERALGVVPGELTTAAPLGEELKERARRALSRVTGREVQLVFKVEPDLIGGAVAKVGSTVYDGSLRTHLTLLRGRMAEE